MIIYVHRLARWLGLPHWYLSTGCLHGNHAYCAGMTGYAGAKRPSRCKFCDARCRCRCHRNTIQPNLTVRLPAERGETRHGHA